jgi:phage tail P2-like protein
VTQPFPSSLLPPNATALEKALEALTGQRVGDIAVPLRDLWSAQNCPEDLLPWLAWGLSIDQWDANWPVYVRRARIASAIAIQRIKGTAKSVLDVVASFGGQVVVREWFEQDPPAAPHTFELTVSLGGQGTTAPSADFIDAVIAEVARTKPARSHFTFNAGLTALGRIGLRSVGRAMIHTRISCRAPAA